MQKVFTDCYERMTKVFQDLNHMVKRRDEITRIREEDNKNVIHAFDQKAVEK